MVDDVEESATDQWGNKGFLSNQLDPDGNGDIGSNTARLPQEETQHTRNVER